MVTIACDCCKKVPEKQTDIYTVLIRTLSYEFCSECMPLLISRINEMKYNKGNPYGANFNSSQQILSHQTSATAAKALLT